MTNEAIKALMILALYGVLEITLYRSSLGALAKRAVRSSFRPARRDRAGRSSED